MKLIKTLTMAGLASTLSMSAAQAALITGGFTGSWSIRHRWPGLPATGTAGWQGGSFLVHLRRQWQPDLAHRQQHHQGQSS